jgi:hypothetical protein
MLLDSLLSGYYPYIRNSVVIALAARLSIGTVTGYFAWRKWSR